MVDLRISEALGKVADFNRGGNLGAVARKFANKLEQGQSFKNPMSTWINTAHAAEPNVMNVGFAEASKQSNATKGIKPTVSLKPLGDSSGSATRAESNQKAEISKMIGAGWEDAEDVLSSTKKALESSGKVVSNLGKVRDQYLLANDEHKRKTDLAISGNKTLIEKNQGAELDDLGGDIRNSVKNAQLMLGVKGASGGSASKAASKAITRAAGKNRAAVLTARGDEFSAQNQAAENAVEEFNLRREQAYEWEKKAKAQAEAELKAGMSSIKKLKDKAGSYKSKDQEAQSDKYLTRFLQNLAEISAIGRTIRDTAYAKMQEFGGSVDELESASIDIDPPSELDTPEFDEDINLEDPENAEDFFDPKNKGKQRVIVGTDAFGNPIYEDDLAAALVA